MPLLPVPYLVGDDRYNLVDVHTRKKGISQDYPLCPPYPREIGVCVPAPAGGIDLQYPAQVNPRLLREIYNPSLQRLVLQGCKLVEERLYEVGGYVDDEYPVSKEKSPYKATPVSRPPLDEREGT